MKKLNKELLNLTEDFTPEKREFYKKILVSIYSKWLPLIEEAKDLGMEMIGAIPGIGTIASFVDIATYFATEPKPGLQSAMGKSLSIVFGIWIALIG